MAILDCHEGFPGDVFAKAWNSCPDCGGWRERPVWSSPPALDHRVVVARLLGRVAS